MGIEPCGRIRQSTCECFYDSPPTKSDKSGVGLRTNSGTYLPSLGSPPRSDLRERNLLGPATVCRVFVFNVYNTEELCPEMFVQEFAGFVGGLSLKHSWIASFLLLSGPVRQSPASTSTPEGLNLHIRWDMFGARFP